MFEILLQVYGQNLTLLASKVMDKSVDFKFFHYNL
jgi:hypothetical protein